MKTNVELQNDVTQAIGWEPLLKSAGIVVNANDGKITLTGSVDNYGKKIDAEHAAKHVTGVKEIVNSIEVKLSNDAEKNDVLLCKDVENTLKLCITIPENSIKIIVENGNVIMEGQIQWNHQCEEARKAISHIVGVKDVCSKLKIKTEASDNIEKKSIEDALARHALINAEKIVVDVTGNNVILKGTVTSMIQKDEAGRVAWKAPGVWSIDNKIEVIH